MDAVKTLIKNVYNSSEGTIDPGESTPTQALYPDGLLLIRRKDLKTLAAGESLKEEPRTGR